MSSASSHRPSREAGFTLLEVMCAFAILVGLTAYVTLVFRNNIDKATTALSRRELREAADTIFRKIIYQHQDYKDGDSRTLDEEYGEFARLRGAARDRWHIYRYVLEKKEQTVAGVDPEGEEGLFGDTQRAEESTSGGSTRTPPVRTTGGTVGDETEEGAGPIKLLHLTLTILRSDEPSSEPLMTISTWIDPNKGKDVVR